jgi:hypothetical protein
VGILHGIAALVVTWNVLRPAALMATAATGVRPVHVLIPLIWCVMVPWAIAGVRRYNRKFDHSQA